jgi:hypothetical protein
MTKKSVKIYLNNFKIYLDDDNNVELRWEVENEELKIELKIRYFKLIINGFRLK